MRYVKPYLSNTQMVRFITKKSTENVMTKYNPKDIESENFILYRNQKNKRERMCEREGKRCNTDCKLLTSIIDFPPKLMKLHLHHWKPIKENQINTN